MKKKTWVTSACLAAITVMCACTGAQEPVSEGTAKETEVTVSKDLAEEPAALETEAEELTTEELFLLRFEEFDECLKERRYEEAYLTAVKAEGLGNFKEECLSKYSGNDDDSVLAKAFVDLIKDDPYAAAMRVSEKNLADGPEFISFVKSNTYVTEIMEISKNNSLNECYREYDVSGRLVKESDGMFVREIEYCGNESLMRQTNLSGEFTGMVYRVYDGDKIVTEINDRRRADYRYDSEGRVTKCEYDCDGCREIREYDENGFLSKTIDGYGRVQVYDYYAGEYVRDVFDNIREYPNGRRDIYKFMFFIKEPANDPQKNLYEEFCAMYPQTTVGKLSDRSFETIKKHLEITETDNDTGHVTVRVDKNTYDFYVGNSFVPGAAGFAIKKVESGSDTGKIYVYLTDTFIYRRIGSIIASDLNASENDTIHFESYKETVKP